MDFVPLNPGASSSAPPRTVPNKEQLRSLETASQVVDSHMNRDRVEDLASYFPGGGELFSFTIPKPARRGTAPGDAAAGRPTVMELESDFVMEHSYFFPEELQEQISKANFSFMGVFPELNRAWVTVDHQLFIWHYPHLQGHAAKQQTSSMIEHSEIIPFNDLDQVIISVAIVRPRPNVFVENVQHLMIIATPVEIVLLAVIFNNEDEGPKGDISLLPSTCTLQFKSENDHNLITFKIRTAHLAIPSDNVNMIKVVGTDTGRIFMSGKDGNLYELQYQAEDGWFRRKCRKVNHTQGVVSSYIPSFLKYVFPCSSTNAKANCTIWFLSYIDILLLLPFKDFFGGSYSRSCR
jgi:hypothetical protein